MPNWQYFLLILVCYVAHTAKYRTYLLKSTNLDKSRFRNCAWQCRLDFSFWKAFSFYCLTLTYVLKFDNLHMTQRAKIIVGFMANVGKFLSNVYKRFFKFFFHVLCTILTFFFKFLFERLLHPRCDVMSRSVPTTNYSTLMDQQLRSFEDRSRQFSSSVRGVARNLIWVDINVN